MKKICLSFLFFSTLIFNVSIAQATTWYVRPTTGGTSTQCTGTTDAAYPGSGTAQACAVNSLYYLLKHHTDDTASTNSTGVVNSGAGIAASDTIIAGEPGSSPGSLEMGYEPTNIWAGCASAFPYGCYLDSLPSGTDSAHPTRLLGRQYNSGCVTKTQLWGNERLKYVLYEKSNSNIDIQCIEITDRSACVVFHPSGSTVDGFPVQCQRSTYPYGPWADTGLKIDTVNNLTMTNVDIHGLADRGMFGLRNGTTTLTNVTIDNNGWAGYDGDDGGAFGTLNYSGDQTWTNVSVEQNGCGERYPLQSTTLNSPLNIHNCFSQSQGGYGDGVGMPDMTITNWTVNNSTISHNVQDGWDQLHDHSTGTIKFYRSKVEGNGGNQFKSNNVHVYLENSLVIGNCGYFAGQAFTYTTGTFDHCRATGEAIISAMSGGATVSVANSTILSNGTDLIGVAGSGCDANSRIDLNNNIFYGGKTYLDNSSDVVYIYKGGADGNGSGTCGSSFTGVFEDYNIVYKTRNSNAGCVGAHDKCGVDPLFVGTIKQGPSPSPGYYTAADYYSQLTIQSSSPARNAGNTGVTLQGTSNDFNNYSRSPQYDIGGYEFGSTASCSAVGVACNVGGDCCSATCCSSVCSASSCGGGGAANGASCSVNSDCSSNQCCSGTCSASACVSATGCLIKFQTLAHGNFKCQ